MSTNDHRDEDAIKGRILGRREVLALMGTSGAAAILVACGGDDTPSPTPAITATRSSASGPGAPGAATPAPATGATTAVPACVVVPELTEGPYFVDENLNRSDIRSDSVSGTIKPGAPLTLLFNVAQVAAGGCTLLPNAKVDIWHCDAQGAYSGVQDPNAGSTRGQTFLRGYQTTNANGQVSFTTIYPGWYPGRAVHIHFKVRFDNKEFTSQLFFDDTLSTQVLQQAMYQKSGNRTMNSQDGIFRQAGDVLLLKLTRSGDGYTGVFDCGMRV